MAEIKIISGSEEIRLDLLHHRYIPKITPLWLFPGPDPMHISKSPHVKLLRAIEKYGMNWGKLKNTKYVQERRHRYNIGMTRWTDGHVKEHIKVRWKIYQSLKKNGWNKKLAKAKPVILLKKPIIETRYNWESGFLSGPEVMDGMGRCSAAYVLGWKTIPVVWAEDAKPGACEFSKAYNKIKSYK